MNKKRFGIFFTVGGLLLLLCGLVLLKWGSAESGVMSVLPYVCIGLGCGTFGHGVGNIVSERAFRNHPERKKQAEIEAKDERNIAMTNRAKGKAFDLMHYLFGAMMLALALMNTDFAVILMFLAVYLIIVAVFIVQLNKYQKEM